MTAGVCTRRLTVIALYAALPVLGTCVESPMGAPDVGRAGRETASLAAQPVLFVGAGDIADCGSRHGDERTAALLDAMPEATVFTIGDNAYPNGSDADYTNCYDPSWGRHRARTRPGIGNHEYYLGNADGSRRYWGDQIGPQNKYYYSYDIGAWHIIMLNAEKSYVLITLGSEQEVWLRNDLATTTQRCIIAIWHEPRFYSSASTGSQGIRPYLEQAWKDLYAAGAALILNGHVHAYERFAPQDPAGNVDRAKGIREFIIGTGGQSTSLPSGSIRANSEVRGAANGVMKFTLSDGSYTWEFIPVVGATFSDAGSGVCPGAVNLPPDARPGGPYASEGPVSFDASTSSDPEGNVPLTYAWDFGDGATSTGVTPAHSYTTDGGYTVTLVVRDAKGAASTPATTTATIANIAPTVHGGADASILPSGTYALSATFTDPGASDAPWTYSIDWGEGGLDAGTTDRQDLPIDASHVYPTEGTYTVRVQVTDKDGGVGSDEVALAVSTAPAGVVLVGAGDITRCDKTNDEATAALLDGIAGTVFTAGDNLYVGGTLADYTNCYGPSWGRHKARTRPAAGEKDYLTAGGGAFFQYFGAAAAGDSNAFYYSYEAGGWHVVVLNSNIAMTVGSAQEQWLKADLAANQKRCTLAIWHHPRFSSSGTAVRSAVKPLWDDLYAAGAEIVVNGHYRVYERFAPQNPAGTADASGIRQFTVGTGGQTTNTFSTPLATSEVRNSGTFGVLELTLSADGYAWRFVPAGTGTFTDAGSGACH